MPNDYMVRITHSYQDASGVVALWASHSQQLLCYEHTGTVTQKVHIHLTIVGSDVCKKQLRNIAAATGLCVKGNAFCSFKNFDGNRKTYVYMTKGKHDPSFVKGYEQSFIDACKADWRDDNPTRLELIYDQIFDDGDNDALEHQDYIDSQPWSNTPGDKMRRFHSRFYWCKMRIRNYLFDVVHKRMWTPQATNDYRSLVYTYVMRHRLEIPKDDFIKSF